MDNLIGPTVNQVWNVAMYVLHILGVCHKQNSLQLGPIQSSSPTKDLHGWSNTDKGLARSYIRVVGEGVI